VQITAQSCQASAFSYKRFGWGGKVGDGGGRTGLHNMLSSSPSVCVRVCVCRGEGRGVCVQVGQSQTSSKFQPCLLNFTRFTPKSHSFSLAINKMTTSTAFQHQYQPEHANRSTLTDDSTTHQHMTVTHSDNCKYCTARTQNPQTLLSRFHKKTEEGTLLCY
jgi:hypothetical protein